ncbi:TRAFAC clade GTPase domain-containing protein [Geodermatophilus sp. URMC 63]
MSDELSFKVSMLGPTRVGKTSIIASMLHGGQQLLTGTPVTMRAADTATDRRITQTRRALRAALHAGEFRPDSLKSTSEPHEYGLLLDPGVDGAGVRFDLLDFPGEWLDPLSRPDDSQEAWERCVRFIDQSSVLIVPVDAAVLMEADRKEYRSAWPSILTIDQVQDVATRWASTRRVRDTEPALVVFCPVKCEVYFADNGGFRDESDELFQRFMQVYGSVVAQVRAEYADVAQLYCPIDTLGWAELRSAVWTPSAVEASGWRFEPTFTLRADALAGTAQLRTKGADDLLAALCAQLMEARRAADAVTAEAAGQEYVRVKARAERREGLFMDVWLWASRERSRRRQLAEQAGREAQEIRNRLDALDKIVSDIGRRDRGNRVKDL